MRTITREALQAMPAALRECFKTCLVLKISRSSRGKRHRRREKIHSPWQRLQFASRAVGDGVAECVIIAEAEVAVLVEGFGEDQDLHAS